jgi:hypothetical protein
MNLTLSRFACISGLLALIVATPAARAETIEGFESGNRSAYTGVGGASSGSVSGAYAHDGLFGLGLSDAVWIYRNDAAVQVSRGDTLSAWIQFKDAVDGRAYFGFGASALGTLSLVLAPNSSQLIFQNNAGYGFADISSTSQLYQSNKWYRAEVIWGTGGSLIGNLYDSNGTSLLNSVTASSDVYTSGGIAFRGFGAGVKAFDTIQRNGADPIEVNPVPLPAAAWGGLALMGLVAAKRRRRRDV